MPEVNHKNEPSISAPPPIQATPKETISAQAKAISSLDTSNITQEQLEAAIRAVLMKNQIAAVEASKPKEPNWATLTEQQAYDPAVYVPCIDHEITNYMNIQIADPEYDVVWAKRDQRRIGQKMAEGYELLKPEHLHKDFKIPLKFDSEGMYIYEDVVAMRVHKRILYGRRRKALQVSLNQLSNRKRPPRVKRENTFDQVEEVALPYAGKMSYYSEIV